MGETGCEWCRKAEGRIMVTKHILNASGDNAESRILCWNCCVEWCLNLGVEAYKLKDKDKQ